MLAKSERIYRHVGRSRPGEIGLLMGGGDGIRPLARPGQTAAASRETMLSDLCRRIVLDSYAPAAVLVTRRYQCLYLLGATDRYLRVASGHPSHDLLAMAPPGLRTKLRSAIQQVGLDHPQVTMAGGRVGAGTAAIRFRIDVRLVQGDGEELVLVAFVDEPTPTCAAFAACPWPSGRASANWNWNSKPPARSSRVPSTISSYRARSSVPSTRRRCRSARSTSRPTRNC